MFSFTRVPFAFPTFSFPSISLPAAIQSRFVAFVLQKSIGHLVKPGQLDSNQINAQIGSGYVEIKDVEVNEDAINSSLEGLPLKLESGSIGSVAVQIPVQNLLTAPLSLTVDRLELALVLQPLQSDVNLDASIYDHATDQLANSVVSVAQEFIHDELDTNSLRESLLLQKDKVPALSQASPALQDVDDDDMSTHMPGALDPFVNQPFADPLHIQDTIEKEGQVIDDVEGVSKLAQVVERLLARLSFTVKSIRIRILHRGNAELIVDVGSIIYSAGESQEWRDDRRNRGSETSQGQQGDLETEPIGGEKRTIRIIGLELSIRDLHIPHQEDSASETTIDDKDHLAPPSDYPQDDDDEEIDASMTQSMLGLPGPSDSLSGTIYYSTDSIRAHTPPPTDLLDEEDDNSSLTTTTTAPNPISAIPIPAITTTSTLLLATKVFSTGKDPIIVTLTTPPPTSTPSDPRNVAQRLGLKITLGMITIALETKHINALLAMTTLIPSSPVSNSSDPTIQKQPRQTEGSASNSILASIHTNVSLRGVLVILFRSYDVPPSSEMFEHLFEHPRSAQIAAPHLRLQLEELRLTVPSKLPENNFGLGAGVNNEKLTGSIADLSVFFIHSSGVSPSNATESLIASPFLITDQHLATQYNPDLSDPNETSIIVPVINWTDISQTSSRPKRTLWRTKPTSSKPTELGQKPKSQDAFTISVSNKSVANPEFITSELAPLHLFIDTLMLGWVAGLTNEIDTPPKLESHEKDQADGGYMTNYDGYDEVVSQSGRPGFRRSSTTTPRAQLSDLPTVQGDEIEKQRLNDFILADMQGPAPEHTGSTLYCPMIRLEIRHAGSTRSGAFVFDIHELGLSLNQSADASGTTEPASRGRDAKAHFQDDGQEKRSLLPLLASVFWKHAVAFYSLPKDSSARSFLRISPLQLSDQRSSFSNAKPLRPRISVKSGSLPLGSSSSGQAANENRTSIQKSKTTLMEVAIPSLTTEMTKETLDGLQLWADDLAQWAEGGFAPKSSPSAAGSTAPTSTMGSATTSRAQSMIIGSRYFVPRTASTVGKDENTVAPSEFLVQLNIDNANARLLVPRGDETVRPFDITASDIEITVSVKPEGRDETVITTTISDLSVQDAGSERVIPLLSLTSPRRLFSHPVPVIKLRLDSINLRDAKAKQSKVQLAASKLTYTLHPDLSWINDLARFAKAPPGAFEQVIPSERTILNVKLHDFGVHILPPNHPGSLVLLMGDISVGTDLVSGSPELSVAAVINSTSVLLLDDISAPPPENLQHKEVNSGLDHWMKLGYASMVHATNLNVQARHLGGDSPPRSGVDVSDARVELHLCADSIPALATLAGDLATLAPSDDVPPAPPGVTAIPVQGRQSRRDISMTVDENAFRRPPAIGPEPDMVEDDLPTNTDFIDASYGPAAGARPIEDDEFENYDETGGETIRILSNDGINIIEGYFDNLPPETNSSSVDRHDSLLSLRAQGCNLSVHLHSGYDWHRTRKTIDEEAKVIRRRLEKIKQLLASGQAPDDSIERTNTFLFNSVYVGLDEDIEDLEGRELIAAIDANLADEFETASNESWQSLQPQQGQPKISVKKRRRKALTRSKKAEVEIQVQNLYAEVDKYDDKSPLSNRVLATVRELKILDHMKTSTWEGFLTSMRSDSRGNVRETDSNMVRVELKMVRPDSSLPQEEEARLRAKILPIRLHVDQDALDFLKRFFSFQDPNGFQSPVQPGYKREIYFQHIEVFPVELMLDYKPKRVDYKALKEGKTIELMNFFHFEKAEMTLRHITLKGLQGWARLGDTLNDLWTPDVKTNQLADVISGVAPIRSLVNVGTGVADLVLLPIAQYRKDKRFVRGMQKGTQAFMKSTAMETIKLGAKLATGTQVILEHAERALGSGSLQDESSTGGRADQAGGKGKTITAEAMPSPTVRPMSIAPSEHGQGAFEDGLEDDGFDEAPSAVSRYATQPEDVREGIHTAYKSLSKNINAAAQTILAVPMEVYEQSGSGGPVRAVVRAVPIAVIRPMIGASEAFSMALLGLRNTLDPDIIQENEDKYKGAGY